MNRIMIAAPKSGSGKTIFTCGLLNLLKQMEEELGPTFSFKCGPDYIDPMFHRRVLGIQGDNLDSFFSSPDEIRRIVAAAGLEKSDNPRETSNGVLEGVMGIYDGVSPDSLSGSSYEIGAITKTPILLVVDFKGIWTTGISTLKGILLDDKEGLIKGIVLNRISQAIYQSLKPSIERMLLEVSPETKLLGFVPEKKEIAFESRHLGLLLPNEVEGIMERINAFSEMMKEHVDVDGILEIMKETQPISSNELQEEEEVPKQEEGLRLAVARDEAFCFYYRENIKALKEIGIDIVEFSPLHDKNLPENIQGMLFGGGYPELYLKELNENSEMRGEILAAIKNGMPSLAECGGFMYLSSSILGDDGKEYSMVGAIDSKVENQGKLNRFGYLTLETDKDGLLPKGSTVKGHEFHYYDSSNNGNDCVARKARGNASWECMHMGKNHLWGYPHLYYRSNQSFIESFKREMLEYKLNG